MLKKNETFFFFLLSFLLIFNQFYYTICQDLPNQLITIGRNLPNQLIGLSSGFSELKKIVDTFPPVILPKESYSQTEAYRSIQSLEDNVERWFGESKTATDTRKEIYKGSLKKYEHYIDKIMEREKEFKDTYYVFYIVMDSYTRVLQDVTKKVCVLANQCATNADFIFLNAYNPYLGNIKDTTEDITEDIAKSIKPLLLPDLLSAKLSLFGSEEKETSIFGNWIASHEVDSEKILKGTGELLNFSIKHLAPNSTARAHYVAILVKLMESIMILNTKTKEERKDIIQIFVPKNVVDSVAYLSEKNKRPWNVKIIPEGYDDKQQRYTHISPVLSVYQNNPAIIKNYLNELDAVMYLQTSYFVDPSKGLKMFRYSTLNSKEEEDYTNRLNVIIDYIYANRPETTIS